MVTNKKYTTTQIISQLAYILIGTLFFSCAQVVNPTGGKKDTKAPVAISYKPDSAQLNFKSKKIEIEFNEYVQLKNLNDQLIISPPLKETPDIIIQKKSLMIQFDNKEELLPNTTYCINFGSAIQDLNENNPIDNFKYIFSTGNFIDSLTLKGKVQNAFNATPEKGIIVMLYGDPNDSVVYKKKPDYFSKTNSNGNFQINNIKAGKYKLVAIKDVNANYKYDGETEMIGFTDGLIDINKNRKDITINLFQESAKKLFIKKYTQLSYGHFLLIFNKGSDSITVKSLKENQDAIVIFSENKDTLTYWAKNITSDSLVLQVSVWNKIIDTVAFKAITKEAALKSTRSALKLTLLKSPNGNNGFDLNKAFELVFSQPLASINKSKRIELKEDSVLYKNPNYTLGFSPIANKEKVILGLWDSSVTAEYPEKSGKFVDAPIFTTQLPLKENTKYHLFIPPGMFTDIFGLTNDSIKIEFKTQELKFYGTVKLKLTIPETKQMYIVQLLDEKNNVIQEDYIDETSNLFYEYLHPQKYKLKIIYDANRNFKWDTGNYLLKTQPEKIIYNKEIIDIRSNWDTELDWKVE